MNTIATLYAFQQWLDLAAGSDDDRLLTALASASWQMEQQAGRWFSPREAVVVHSVDAAEPSDLALDDDLITLEMLVDDSGEIPLSAVTRLPAHGVAHTLQLKDGRTFAWGSTPQHAVAVSGVWGWHDNPDAMWQDSDDTVLDDPLSAAATTLTVNDVDVTSPGRGPRFQVGHLLRIEDEMLRVLAIDTVSNTLTVMRGANGSSAASHISGSTVEVYQPPAGVVDLCLRWAAWVYRQPDGGAVDGLPDDLMASLRSLRRDRVGA